MDSPMATSDDLESNFDGIESNLVEVKLAFVILFFFDLAFDFLAFIFA